VRLSDICEVAWREAGWPRGRINVDDCVPVLREKCAVFRYMRQLYVLHAKIDGHPRDIKKSDIRNYALYSHDYDTLDVSRIVAALLRMYKEREKND
jgi:hypothetical protein